MPLRSGPVSSRADPVSSRAAKPALSEAEGMARDPLPTRRLARDCTGSFAVFAAQDDTVLDARDDTELLRGGLVERRAELLLVDRRARAGDQRRERICVADGDVGEHLAVDRRAGGLEARH